MAEQGEVLWVPKQHSLAGDPKDRYHILMHDCPAGETGCVAYGSTQDAQAKLGALCVVARPTQANGLDAQTFVYPGLLTPLDDRFFDRRGRTNTDHRASLHALVPAALGFDTGSRRTAGAPAHSTRGAVVGFAADLQGLLSDPSVGAQVAYGIILTPHHLSNARGAWQAVVPVLTTVDPKDLVDLETHLPEFEPNSPEELGIVAGPATPWLARLGAHVRSALILVPDVFHVKRPTLTVEQETVDNTTLARIEATLLARLSSGAP